MARTESNKTAALIVFCSERRNFHCEMRSCDWIAAGLAGRYFPNSGVRFPLKSSSRPNPKKLHNTEPIMGKTKSH